ncbi:DUF1684 domain-containing protein [Agromyces seonyuensis]|uniref:DUF1684 domain-containing protein n=1 Tax=Agromyces seonyuensis TaxID=2662446 RepID=A0A6I4NZ01_9MICO|nr:DUF1684 domain-containing protein [Agromyces seonyuensis]MWB99600.1 DUF1684 domain-containing protein [Agromyces seonyuensis]
MTDTIADAPAQPDAADFARAWAEWHTAHEAARTDRHGFLSVTGLHWLHPAPARFPGVPGEWSLEDEGPAVTLAPDEHLGLRGERLTGRQVFGPLSPGESTLFELGDVVLELANRGGLVFLRPRDPNHPFLAAYTGTPAFPADPAWALPGRLLPAEPGTSVVVGSAAEGLEHVYTVPGTVEFELDGRTHRLTAVNGGAPGTLQLLFADATSGVTTYAANRSLTIPGPDADGRLVVDFNRAVNLPCAYTDHATCPLPPAGNRLDVAIEAGERTPQERAS